MSFDPIPIFAETIESIKRPGMYDGTRLSIELVSGFEKFNARPYHCYETWCQGWRIVDHETGHTVEREHLKDAIDEWIRLVAGLCFVCGGSGDLGAQYQEEDETERLVICSSCGGSGFQE